VLTSDRLTCVPATTLRQFAFDARESRGRVAASAPTTHCAGPRNDGCASSPRQPRCSRPRYAVPSRAVSSRTRAACTRGQPRPLQRSPVLSTPQHHRVVILTSSSAAPAGATAPCGVGRVRAPARPPPFPVVAETSSSSASRSSGTRPARRPAAARYGAGRAVFEPAVGRFHRSSGPRRPSTAPTRRRRSPPSSSRGRRRRLEVCSSDPPPSLPLRGGGGVVFFMGVGGFVGGVCGLWLGGSVWGGGLVGGVGGGVGGGGGGVWCVLFWFVVVGLCLGGFVVGFFFCFGVFVFFAFFWRLRKRPRQRVLASAFRVPALEHDGVVADLSTGVPAFRPSAAGTASTSECAPQPCPLHHATVVRRVRRSRTRRNTRPIPPAIGTDNPTLLHCPVPRSRVGASCPTLLPLYSSVGGVIPALSGR